MIDKRWLALVSALVMAGTLSACDGKGKGADAPRARFEPKKPAPKPASEEAKPTPEDAEPVDKLVEGDPLKPGLPAQQIALAKGKSYYLKGELKNAELVFDTLTRSSPVSSEVISAGIALGDIYTQQERMDEAFELYAFLIDRAPGVPEVRLVVGRAYAKAGQRAEAIAALEKTLELQPSFIFLWPEIGELHAQGGDQAKSAEAFVRYEKEIFRLARILEGGAKEAVEDRVEIADIFSFVEDDRAAQALVNAMKADPNEDVRARCARALADGLAFSARDALRGVEKADPSEKVRKAARAALNDLSGAEVPEEDAAKVGPTVVDDPKKLPE